MKRHAISLLGSTGSIGRQTLDVMARQGHRVAALAAHSNIRLLEEQARAFHPRLVAVMEEDAASALSAALHDLDIQVVAGPEGFCQAAVCPEADTVLTAVVGMVGLLPTLEAIGAGKRIALANKETLVAGGSLVMAAAKAKGVEILPVDSEHSALFQCLEGCTRRDQEVARLILTASGGPFRGKTRQQLQHITPEVAVRHPNWSMGAKISIDSATLMNKGLEFIEAMHLFSVSADKISVVVHPESIVHSMVEYVDGSVLAQLSNPDMRLPIEYAINYPERHAGAVKRLHLPDLAKLTFEEPDLATFPALALCMEAAATGGTLPAALNGGNEAAVALFLKGAIGFLDIDWLLSKLAASHENKQNPTLADILKADSAARDYVTEMAKQLDRR